MSTNYTENISIIYKTRKNFIRTINIIFAYFCFGLFWYFWGPIDYISASPDGSVLLAVLVCSYFIAFYFGYILRYRQFNFITPPPKSKKGTFRFLHIFIWINLVFTALNALQYTYTVSISELWDLFLEALADPGTAYFSKIATMKDVGTSDSVLTYITVFLAPVFFPTLVLSLYYFKKLNVLEKVGVVTTLCFEAIRWISLGTNKGLLDIAVLFFTVMILRAMRSEKNISTQAARTRQRRYLLIAVGAIVIFIVVFSTFLTSRSSAYPPNIFQNFPYDLIPEGLRASVYKITSYLCQGYRSLQHIITNEEWIPTWGIGNSTFLLSVFYRITGVNLSALTYQTRICETGLVSSGAFQSSFAYFANDLSFVGVIFLMFFAGYFFCSILKEAVIDEDPISITLVYMMLLGIINISCLNYMLSFSNMFVGFWGLFWIRIIKKKVKIRIGDFYLT